MTITLTSENALSVKVVCSSLMEGVTTIPEVAQVVRKVISSFLGVMYGPLHYRSLEPEELHGKFRLPHVTLGGLASGTRLVDQTY